MESVISGLLKPDPLTIVVSENPTVIALKDSIQGIQGEGGDAVPAMKDHRNPLGVKKLAGPFDHRHVVVGIGHDPYPHPPTPSHARVPESALTPAAWGQLINLLQFGVADRVDDQLCNPIAILDDKGLITLHNVDRLFLVELEAPPQQ